ncbi:MAG: PIN domain-containing protein [Gemmatimonadetes bacterium]|nr:PIN domain-containing protein [Gemmatimonadota bacterium]
MIYVDTSVALAHLLAEDHRPPADLWAQELVTSRLLEYEVWGRIHARDLTRSHGDLARLLLARLSFVEMDSTVLSRAAPAFCSACADAGYGAPGHGGIPERTGA